MVLKHHLYVARNPVIDKYTIFTCNLKLEMQPEKVDYFHLNVTLKHVTNLIDLI